MRAGARRPRDISKMSLMANIEREATNRAKSPAEGYAIGIGARRGAAGSPWRCFIVTILGAAARKRASAC